jgi:hypothetical protein
VARVDAGHKPGAAFRYKRCVRLLGGLTADRGLTKGQRGRHKKRSPPREWRAIDKGLLGRPPGDGARNGAPPLCKSTKRGGWWGDGANAGAVDGPAAAAPLTATTKAFYGGGGPVRRHESSAARPQLDGVAVASWGVIDLFVLVRGAYAGRGGDARLASRAAEKERP